MFARQLLASALVALIASPAWPATNPAMATAGPSQEASVHGIVLTSGATLFNGDYVQVGAHGDAALSFGRGSMARLGEETTLQLVKNNNSIAFELLRGRVAFRTSEQLPVEARLADASIRSADGLAAIGVVGFRTPKLVVVTAQKGHLLLSTAHDSRSVSLKEGESVEMRLDTADPDQGQDRDHDRRAAGASAPGLSHRQWVTVAVILGAATLAVGLAIALGAFGASNKQDLISPFKFP